MSISYCCFGKLGAAGQQQTHALGVQGRTQKSLREEGLNCGDLSSLHPFLCKLGSWRRGKSSSEEPFSQQPGGSGAGKATKSSFILPAMGAGLEGWKSFKCIRHLAARGRQGRQAPKTGARDSILVGIPALSYFSEAMWGNEFSSEHLVDGDTACNLCENKCGARNFQTPMVKANGAPFGLPLLWNGRFCIF